MTDPDLAACLDRAWASLEAGASPGKSRFSMAQLATIGLDGAPKVRTIVLRRADRAVRRLAFYTDKRSPKVAELTADPRVSLIGYDMEAGVQVRIDGLAELYGDDEGADAAWAATPARSRISYRSPHAPGAVLSDPVLGDATESATHPDDPEDGRNAFLRIRIETKRLEWLDLAVSGHRRAAFDWRGDGWQGCWLAP